MYPSGTRGYRRGLSRPTDLLKQAARRVRDSAPAVAVRRRLYDQKFARTRTWRNLARGLYRSFDEARRDSPPSMPAAYVLDDEAYARDATVEPHDYPALFWLRDRLEAGCTVLDLGGHVGLQYYLYGRYVRYAPATRWIVAEQPHVVPLGREMARARVAPHLSFVEDHAGVDADVFFTAGTIQSIEAPLPALIDRLARRPRAVLVNKLPLYDRETRVTVQNTGRSFTPCYLFNAAELIGSVEALGYRLRDRWKCLDRSIHIPFHDDHDIAAYSGLYFEAR